MGIELHGVTLAPVRPLGVRVVRSPVVADTLVGVHTGEVDRVAVEVHIVVDEGLAEDVGEVSAEGKELPAAFEAETAVDRSGILKTGVLGEGILIEVLGGTVVGGGHIRVVTGDIPHRGAVGRVDAGEDRAIEADGLSLDVCETVVGHLPAVALQILIPCCVEELGDSLLVVVEDAVEAQVVVAVLEDVDTDGKVDTGVGQSADVGSEAGETGRVGVRNAEEHVRGLTIVVLKLEVEEVEHAGVEADGEETLLLPGEVVVGRLADHPCIAFIVGGSGADEGEVAVVTDGSVTLGTVADLHAEVVEPGGVLYETLVAGIPLCTERPEGGVAYVGTETRGSIVTDGSVHDILAHVAVVGVAEE